MYSNTSFYVVTVTLIIAPTSTIGNISHLSQQTFGASNEMEVRYMASHDQYLHLPVSNR